MLRDLALTIGDAAAICAAIVFLTAAFGKVRHRATLAAVVANYRLLPPVAVAPVSFVLPWLEAGIGAALLLGERRWAPALAVLLLAAFAAAMAVNIRRGRAHIDCGCGVGGLRQSLHPALVARNLLLAGALLLAGGAPLAPIEHVAAIATGLVFFLLILLLNALLALPGLRARQA